MWDYDTTFYDIITRTPHVKSFRFPVSTSDVTYKPGQFFFVTIKINGIEVLHHFSISSSPTENDYLEFTKKITAHPFSQALDAIKQGEWAHLSGPMGSFTLPQRKEKLAFLTGGIGITPLRSMLRFIADTGQFWDIVLLYSSSSYEEIVFRDELDILNSLRFGLRVEYVLSGHNDHPGWRGLRGLIDSELITEQIPDYKERLFFLSGPPGMVLSLQDQLLSLSISQEKIKTDSFTGYD